jgi:hypothetical protein
MIKAIAVGIFAVALSFFVMHQNAFGQTATPTPTTAVTATPTQSSTATPTPTGSSTTVPSGAPDTGFGPGE